MEGVTWEDLVWGVVAWETEAVWEDHPWEEAWEAVWEEVAIWEEG